MSPTTTLNQLKDENVKMICKDRVVFFLCLSVSFDSCPRAKCHLPGSSYPPKKEQSLRRVCGGGEWEPCEKEVFAGLEFMQIQVHASLILLLLFFAFFFWK